MRITKTHIVSVLLGAGALVATVFLLLCSATIPNTFADDATTSNIVTGGKHHVIIQDQGSKLVVKTDATTVADALERAHIALESSDKVEPSPDSIIDSNNFHINIYRGHPAVIIDGTTRQYLMTSSYDPATVAAEAGLTIYDGDTIESVTSDDFLETGATATYQITRNGGRTVTVEESIPFATETRTDYSKTKGESEVAQVGEDGRKVIRYQVNFVDGVEVSRELISEEITVQPVNRVVVEGAKANLSVSPEQETCANWARQAGVAEADLGAAMFLIYHESGCRVDAANASSGAYGIPQALPGSKMASAGADWQTNPVTQIRWMAGYVSRYGGWQGAYAFWNEHHWY